MFYCALLLFYLPSDPNFTVHRHSNPNNIFVGQRCPAHASFESTRREKYPDLTHSVYGGAAWAAPRRRAFTWNARTDRFLACCSMAAWAAKLPPGTRRGLQRVRDSRRFIFACFRVTKNAMVRAGRNGHTYISPGLTTVAPAM